MPRTRPVVWLAASLAACATSPPHESSWSCSPRLQLSSVWRFLSDKYDHDDDGAVTRAEYGRGDNQFDNYDRNGNGTLEASDFPDDTFFNGFNHMIVMRADADEDEQVTRAEWDAFGATLNPNGRDTMQPDEVGKVLGSWANDWPLFLLSFDQDLDGQFTATDLDLTFRDQDFDGDGTLAGKETQGWQPPQIERTDPPEPGAVAPDFTLAYADAPSRTFHLHGSVTERPVALIFGSYT